MKIPNSKAVNNIFYKLQENPVEALQIFFMGDMKWMEIYLVTQLNQFVTQGSENHFLCGGLSVFLAIWNLGCVLCLSIC